jgi:4-hydroxybenzoate polyprenyltransferase
MKYLKSFIKLIRVRQWIKNLLILFPLFFSNNLFNSQLLIRALITISLFSLLCSGVYIINDIKDIDKDKNHPKKRFRPIANNEISIKSAVIIAFSFLVTSLLGCYFMLGINTVILFIIYLILNLLYTIFLKQIVLWDIIVLSLFYILRVYIGGISINIDISPWLATTTFFVSLFLSAGKRYTELLRLGNTSRDVLSKYKKEFLVFVLYLSSLLSITFYSLFALSKSTYYEFSIILVVIGFLIYFMKLYDNKIEEDPSLLILKDKQLIGILLIWVLYLTLITYFIK